MADLGAQIRAGDIAPIYFLTGERHPVEEIVSALREAVIQGEENPFNFDLLTVPEAGAAQITGAARTVPMMGGRRLVLVRDAHLLKGPELDRLAEYAADPNPTSCLVMVGDKVDGRLKAIQRLKKLGFVHSFAALKDRQVSKWVQGEARRLGIKLAPGAAERIAEAVGADMARLASSLEMLDLYAGAGEAVRPNHVEELLDQTRERNIFELTNAVGRGQRREALVVLKRMIDAREPGLRIVAMLTRHLRQLWSVKEMMAAGKAQDAMARKIGIHPFFLKDMVRQAGRVKHMTLRRMHKALFETDRALKSSRLPDALILQKLVLQLCPAG